MGGPMTAGGVTNDRALALTPSEAARVVGRALWEASAVAALDEEAAPAVTIVIDASRLSTLTLTLPRLPELTFSCASTAPALTVGGARLDEALRFAMRMNAAVVRDRPRMVRGGLEIGS